MMNIVQKAVNAVWYAINEKPQERPKGPVDVDALYPQFKTSASIGYTGYANPVNTLLDGDKFPGGFGSTMIQTIDYWTLRKRSSQLFNDNLYARGLIRRLITNEINTGLTPEAAPEESVIGLPEDSLTDWTELTESRFSVWAATPEICDFEKRRTFGQIQREARREALIEGDVLVILRYSPRTNVPSLQLIRGDKVRTPLQSDKLTKGHTIRHGVERDAQNRDAAFWVKQKDGTIKRLPAKGARSGRRISWLVYGTDKRTDEVRGTPLLSIILQSLKEIDRYRDSAQRKAVINSMLAMYIKKTSDKPGTLPVTGGALRKSEVTTTSDGNEEKIVRTTASIPGVVMEELQTGEEPVGFHSQGTDIDFAKFEEAIVAGIAWANEIPPEILTLAFSNNYSASQAAINEFKIYLNLFWAFWGEGFCSPIYREWLVSETINGKIIAPGFLDSRRDPTKFDIFGAWILADWYGSIKPSTDALKQARGSELLLEMGMSTRAREARINTGTKYSKNVKRLKKENAQLVEAKRPMAEFRKEFNETEDVEPEALSVSRLEEVLDNYLSETSADV